MSAQQQYDEIGEAYEGFKALPLEQYAVVPGFLALVGDVSGKSVLDLASGTGFYSREFKRRGATDVLGIDISGEMVAVAQKLEEHDPLGVRYEVGDVSTLRTFEQPFDVVLAVQLLNYAPDIATTELMCRNIHQSLKPGAELFLLNQSPDFRFDGPTPDKYGFRSELTGEEAETGPKVRTTALLDPSVSFVANRPRREVYEDCLKAAGFTELTWVPVEVSEAGVREFGADHWADLYANPRWKCCAAAPDGPLDGPVEGQQEPPQVVRQAGRIGRDAAVEPVREDAGEGGGDRRGDEIRVRGARGSALGAGALAQLPVEAVAERAPAAGEEQGAVERRALGGPGQEIRQRGGGRAGGAPPGRSARRAGRRPRRAPHRRRRPRRAR